MPATQLLKRLHVRWELDEAVPPPPAGTDDGGPAEAPASPTHMQGDATLRDIFPLITGGWAVGPGAKGARRSLKPPGFIASYRQ
jgi:hypothetical protein